MEQSPSCTKFRYPHQNLGTQGVVCITQAWSAFDLEGAEQRSRDLPVELEAIVRVPRRGASRT